MTNTAQDTPPSQDAAQPGKPPLWRRTWFQITAGLALVLVALIMIGSATNTPNAVTPAARASHAAPAPKITQGVPTPPAPVAPASQAPAAPASQAPAGPYAVATQACTTAWAKWQAIGADTGQPTVAQAQTFATWAAAEAATVTSSGEPRHDDQYGDAGYVANNLAAMGRDLVTYAQTQDSGPLTAMQGPADHVDFGCADLNVPTNFTGSSGN